MQTQIPVKAGKFHPNHNLDTHSRRGFTYGLGKLAVLALLVTLALIGWNIPPAYSVCNSNANDCLPGGGTQPTKKDFYCAYPVLTFMKVTDAHESSVTGPWAYMYFDSAVSPKTGSYADYLGTGLYTPFGAPPQTKYNYNNDAWASNFKGPNAISGESSRTQWEWNDPKVEFYGYEAASWGNAGTPYQYGHRCVQVSVGAARSSMGYKTEDVYEDDECILGLCNPDDYVGGFRISRHKCETDVWSKGYLTGWTNAYWAGVWDDIAAVRYKLWCYACKDTTSCSTGVGPNRGSGY